MTDNPETRLIVYGSLAPGGVNAFMLAGLVGEWYPCRIRGRMGTYLGFKSFRYDPQGPEHPAWLFRPRNSPGLSRARRLRGGGIRAPHHPRPGERPLGHGPGTMRANISIEGSRYSGEIPIRGGSYENAGIQAMAHSGTGVCPGGHRPGPTAPDDLGGFGHGPAQPGQHRGPARL